MLNSLPSEVLPTPACTSISPEKVLAKAQNPNVIVIVADDLGVDPLASYHSALATGEYVAQNFTES